MNWEGRGYVRPEGQGHDGIGEVFLADELDAVD